MLAACPRALTLAVMVAAATLPYLNTLHGRFVYDDKVRRAVAAAL